MARARTRPWTAVPPQDGRRFVVTGATSGIGLETARRLVAAGAHVVLAVRSLEKGEQVAAPLRASLVGSVEVRRLDVSDLSSVREFAAGVGDVDVLVNNAGVLGLPFARSVDGFELQLATNHLGHFALANLLLPRITDRVVVVASQSHRSGELDLTDLDWTRRGYRPYAAYASSKQANLLFLGELQRRLTAAGSRLRATGAHPGYTSTAIQAGTGSAAFTRLAGIGNALLGMPPWQGALPTLYAGTMDVPGNTYLGPHRFRELNGWPVPVGRSRNASDPDLARALWAESESLTGVAFPL
ncbi:NAD(P)-dependent dehydrogenase (short-subunit alcohol dehydrogenase family) [Nocardioides ginsengisegetis]|uniref:NAD(P)-dependent dehydrogenase (Short-subunit alcohol dehydrogenase family) n=1 Tax=Nocardioides ginsengisegetis TaxID=661491 RepID=A0A7W3IZ88_9ACTN|nr:NAD(P)-dependent dehydrogenase (short-subunit alcohol dehydrogenase family) [Nocardioides ginsengisegetis]